LNISGSLTVRADKVGRYDFGKNSEDGGRIAKNKSKIKTTAEIFATCIL